MITDHIDGACWAVDIMTRINITLYKDHRIDRRGRRPTVRPVHAILSEQTNIGGALTAWK